MTGFFDRQITKASREAANFRHYRYTRVVSKRWDKWNEKTESLSRGITKWALPLSFLIRIAAKEGPCEKISEGKL